MKILHITPSLSHSYGGPSQSVSLALKGLWNRGVDCEVITFDAPNGDSNVMFDERIHLVPLPFEKRYKYSRPFKNNLYKFVEFDLFHIHGVWEYPNYLAAKLASSFRKPYIFTPRGMLYPNALSSGNSLMKKVIFSKYLKSQLLNSTCIHATCEEEMVHLRDLGINSPIAVIPNPIDFHRFDIRRKDSKFKLGYLGRLHPRKRIDRLIQAWSNVSTDSGNLLIIGDGPNEYVKKLKDIVNSLKLNNVIFTGQLTGSEKYKVLSSLSVSILPSDFENFGMSVAESLMVGVPVIATQGSPWRGLEKAFAGWWIPNDLEALENAILVAKNTSHEILREMGNNGINLIKDKFTVEHVSNDLQKLYAWILNNSDRPDFVYIK